MTDNQPQVLLGRIVTAHGIRGEVVIHSFTADPADIGAYGPLLTDKGNAITLTSARVTNKGVVARVAGVADRNAAEALRGTQLYVMRDRLPAAAEGEYYHTDLIGLAVDNASGERIGSVLSVQNFGAGDLLELKLDGQRDTEFIPFTDAFVPVVDLSARRIVVEFPVLTEVDESETDDEQPS